MKQRAQLVLIMIAGLLLASCVILAEPTAPEPPSGAATPEEAARQDLPEFLDSVRAGDFPSLGFRSQEELDHITLGEPYEVYRMRLDELKDYRSGDSLASITSFVPFMMDFPLLVNGEHRSFLGVARNKFGRWQADSIGGEPLVGWLKHVRSLPGNENLPCKMINIQPLGARLMLVDTPGQEKLIPLGGIKGFPDSSGRYVFQPHTLDEIVPKLAQAWEDF